MCVCACVSEHAVGTCLCLLGKKRYCNNWRSLNKWVCTSDKLWSSSQRSKWTGRFYREETYNSYHNNSKMAALQLSHH